jgi:hypothetical protein
MTHWEAKIRKVENGYILSYCNIEDGSITEEVFEESEEEELTTMVDLLYRIKEYFGVYSSKHNKKNIYIRIESTDTP